MTKKQRRTEKAESDTTAKRPVITKIEVVCGGCPLISGGLFAYVEGCRVQLLTGDKREIRNLNDKLAFEDVLVGLTVEAAREKLQARANEPGWDYVHVVS